MQQLKPWTQYEDAILQKLKNEEKILNWTDIAQKMTQQYNIKGRSAKQCKQRFQNLFQTNEVNQWTFQQQKMLFNLHNQLGNKWGIIGQQIMGRSDNQVKNHLYSKLRKGLRKINKIIKQNFKKEFKQIKPNLICKITEGAQDKFKNIPLFDKQTSEYCTQLKMKLIEFSYDDNFINPLNDFENNYQDVKRLIQEFIDFTKGYKRKPKHVRRASGLQIDIILPDISNGLALPVQNKRNSSNGNSKEDSFDSQQEDIDQMKQFNVGHIKVPYGIINNQKIHKQNDLSMKQIKQNIILKSPEAKQFKCQMQEQRYQNNNTFNNFIPQTHIQRNAVYYQDSISENNTKKSSSLKSINSFTKSWKNRNQFLMIDETQSITNQLRQVGIIQEQQITYNNSLFPHLNKKISYSKKSSFSSYLQIEEEAQQNIFNDDSLKLKNPKNSVDQKKIWHLGSVDGSQSDKLFKSNQKQHQFFGLQSIESKLMGSNIIHTYGNY